MPPNLGGFFMVRSYYPSECHADYFDFERIEALKPAIEACGISTLSQSPMLGFHKQMDNRIKLLEEILSFRMQGVEFDNGDMYVDGHKAASDVRDEFVSVTEKLMDELAQCYNVLPQLDINNTIDHRPEWDEKWFLENEKTVTQFCRELAAERPLKDIRDEYNYPKKKEALNGRFNTSITHAYSIVIGSKHITLNATGGGFLTASKQFRHGATSKSRSNTASNSTKHKSPHLSGWRQIISLIT